MRPALWRPSLFTGLWISAAANSFARTAIQLALSWITLQLTGSPFMVGVVSAVRMAPQVPLGIPAGILADWLDRRALVVAVTAASTAVALGIAALLAVDVLLLPAILAAAIAVGLLDTLRTTVTQAYAYDLVYASHAARGLAFVNLGAHLLGTLGGLAGGYALEHHGASATFVLVAAVLAVGAAVPALAAGGPVGLRPDDAADPSAVNRDHDPRGAFAKTSAVKRARPSFTAAVTLVVRNRLIAVLVLTIVVAEILGFSSATIMPTFARDVFAVGATGLGTLTAARSLGGVLGLAVLSRVGTRNRSGAVLLGAAAIIGLALLAFAITPRFELALLSLALVGAASAVLDTLSQMLLQQSVDERERGAAMGTWVFSIGFGPLGHLAVGGLAVVFGAPPTLALFGATLALVVVSLSRYAPLRQLP